MSPYEPNLRISRRDDMTQVDVLDTSLTDELAIRNLGDKLEELVGSDPQMRLVLNFEAVDFMSSTALGVLVGLRKRVEHNDAALRLCALGPTVRQALEITGLHTHFKILSTAEEAASSF
ncbi:MAG: STAS domain-containing protein [Phycisphaerae bacterium]|nr:STAS domain-containing protein [Phycisphaerae bacterium]